MNLIAIVSRGYFTQCVQLPETDFRPEIINADRVSPNIHLGKAAVLRPHLGPDKDREEQ